ncbi:MAG TPA: ABC transporter ATP-binding protein [Candidatus Babeliales bacterium]|nr:ABC transporter ATP-binding protein [Candidatus Babeliales bacterium]
MAFLKTENICKQVIIDKSVIPILRNISFSIEPGEFITLAGPSGSGKSTLINILGCLDMPSSGTYSIDQTDVSRMNPNQLAAIRNKTIGFIFQQFNLLPDLTAVDNVALPQLYAGFSEPSARINALAQLEAVGLKDLAYRFPYQLSGGQQQRVAIARALINNPAIILADEPTGNLDSKAGLQVMKLLTDLNNNNNCTIVMVTHNATLTKHANRIITLLDGTITDDTKTG